MVNTKTNKSKQRNAGVVEHKQTLKATATAEAVTVATATATMIATQTTTNTQHVVVKQKGNNNNNSNNSNNKNGNNKKLNNNNASNKALTTQYNSNGKQSNSNNNNAKSQEQQQRKTLTNTNTNTNRNAKNGKARNGTQQQPAKNAGSNSSNNSSASSMVNMANTYAETVGRQSNNNNNSNSNNTIAKTRNTRIYTNSNSCSSSSNNNNNNNNNNKKLVASSHNNNNNNNNSNSNKLQTQKSDIAVIDELHDDDDNNTDADSIVVDHDAYDKQQMVVVHTPQTNMSASEMLTAALTVPCAKCSKSTLFSAPVTFSNHQYRKCKSYVGGGDNSARNSVHSIAALDNATENLSRAGKHNNNGRHHYHRSYSDRRSSFDRNFAERNKDFVPIAPPARPVLSSSNIAAVIADAEKLVIIERLGKGRTSYPIMQCGTLDASDSSYHQQRSNRMDVYQIDDGFHSDGTETPPPSPSSGSSIASASDHGSLESVDTGGTQRLAVLSFEQVNKLHDVMDEKVAIHGRGNFPTLEVTLKDLVNLVRRKLEADVNAGGAGVIVKDVRLNGGAASHVLASEDQPYNDLDLIYAIELSSSRHFDRVKTAVLNTLLDLLPEGVSKRRIMPCALKEAYVGKMVKVNNNNDGDRWSLISLGNSPGHKNVELKFVDTMRRQFEFSVDSFQIVLDSLLLFYDCAALPISENFYPTVVGESVYGDFQEALYHLQKKLISTRQPEEIRGGGLLKYCNLLVRNYKPVDPQRIKTLERYMCSRFFIDFPDINTQTVKLEAYLRNHFWGVDEEPLQYKYLMHLREVVEMSTVCLMGHERRQTLLLIQSLAAQVLYKEQQKQQVQEQYLQQQQQQQQQHVDLQNQQQQQTVTLVSTQQQQLVQQPQTIYVQQAPPPPQTTAICCAALTTTSEQQSAAQQQQQQIQVQVQQQQATTATAVPQTIQLQAGPPGLIYNGVFYAPVLPAPICTCNSTWLST